MCLGLVGRDESGEARPPAVPDQGGTGGVRAGQSAGGLGVGEGPVTRLDGATDAEGPAGLRGDRLPPGGHEHPYDVLGEVDQRRAERGAERGGGHGVGSGRLPGPRLRGRVHHHPPPRAQQHRHLLRPAAQQQPYQRRGPGRSRAALVLAGEEGEQDGGDGGDGVVAGFAGGGGHPEDEAPTGAEGVGGEMNAGGGVGGGGGGAGAGGAYDLGELGQRVPGGVRHDAPRRRDLRPLRPVQHRPPGEPLRQLPQHRRHRIRAGRGGGEALLGLGHAPEFGEAGLGHELPDRAGHTGEGGLGRDLDQGEFIGVAGRHQGARHGVVHRRETEAQGRSARRHDPGDVVVEVRPDPAASGTCTPAVSSSSPPSRYGYGSAISEVCAQWMTAAGSTGPAICRSARSSRASSAASGTGGVGGTAGSGMVCVSFSRNGLGG